MNEKQVKNNRHERQKWIELLRQAINTEPLLPARVIQSHDLILSIRKLDNDWHEHRRKAGKL